MFRSFAAIAVSLLTMFLVRPEQGAQQSASKMAFDPESMPKVDEDAPQCVMSRTYLSVVRFNYRSYFHSRSAEKHFVGIIKFRSRTLAMRLSAQ